MQEDGRNVRSWVVPGRVLCLFGNVALIDCYVHVELAADESDEIIDVMQPWLFVVAMLDMEAMYPGPNGHIGAEDGFQPLNVQRTVQHKLSEEKGTY